jgi:interferon gamma-inducible protein 30
MNITAVPYGNAQIDYTTETVTCQHGEQECSANLYEQCGMYLYPDQAIWMPYYVCLESKGSGEGGGGDAVIAAVPECATAAGMDADAVEACHADSTLAWQLQEQAAALTEAADHTYTPWVTVDGVLLNYDFQFKKMICDAYTGTPPDVCVSMAPKRCDKN